MATYIEIADWATLQNAAAQVRVEVFVKEQGIRCSVHSAVPKGFTPNSVLKSSVSLTTK